MSNPLQIIGAAMRAEADALRVVSLNVANAETTAYRRQIPISHAGQLQFDQLLGNVSQELGAASSSASSATTPLQVALDLQAGTLKSTAEPLHVALDGAGFFALQPAPSQLASSGQELLLTRRGDWHVSSDGYLAATSGALVLGGKGPIYVGSSTPVISADGSVRVDNQLVDELRLVNVSDSAQLHPSGDGTYRVGSNTLSEGERAASVRQGFLETSNVVPMNEIIQLMETVRRFEAEQKFAQAYDGILDKAISQLGKTS